MFIQRLSTVLTLTNGATTTVHLVRYDRRTIRAKVVAFGQPTYLAEWCRKQGYKEALSGGFFLQGTQEVLGELWVEGHQHVSAVIQEPWGKTRGSVYVDSEGNLTVGPRNLLPPNPEGGLLQAGPMLIQNAVLQIKNGTE